eukprot:m.112824 g.112824  ORF g.112824 m.112824 type:complete len:449 (+) comp13491_c0_seq3:89-1435(+)
MFTSHNQRMASTRLGDLEVEAVGDPDDNGASSPNLARRLDEDLLGKVSALLEDVAKTAVPDDQREKLVQRARALNAQLSEAKEKTKQKFKSTADKLKKHGTELKTTVTKYRRKVITGDPEKRVRDFVKETPVVKTIDKVSFTFGVLALNVIQGIVLKAPSHFGWFYCIIMIPLLAARYYLYKADKFQFFLMDFCYFLNAATALCVFLPGVWDGNLLHVCFVMANGPLAWAIVAWRNSLVFHSLDKVTSVYIHILPPLATYCWRWFPGYESTRQHICTDPQDPSTCSTDMYTAFVYPYAFYLTWQVFYYIVVDVVHSKEFKEDQELQTSLRWLYRSESSATTKVMRHVAVALHLINKDESLQEDTVKGKLSFMVLQFIYTVLTTLPCIVLYQYFWLHTAFLMGISVMVSETKWCRGVATSQLKAFNMTPTHTYVRTLSFPPVAFHRAFQ